MTKTAVAGNFFSIFAWFLPIYYMNRSFNNTPLWSHKMSKRCSRCDGSGEVICSNCGGKGYVLASNDEMDECSACDGLGTLECPACNGMGVYSFRFSEAVSAF